MADFYVRAAATRYATEVLEKVHACAEGTALVTGARLELRQSGPRYDARIPNPKLVALARDNMIALGLDVTLASGDEHVGSSDMGNVSQVVPTIHPYIAIGPEEMAGHSSEFHEAAGSPEGHEALIGMAKTLAMTAVELLAASQNLSEAKEAFQEQKRQQAQRQ